MNPSLGTTPVEDVMSSTVFSVAPTDKIATVARLLDRHDVNAAPVVDADNVCVGIITSHDMVEFEAMYRELENQARHGQAFDLAHYGDGTPPRSRVDRLMKLPITCQPMWRVSTSIRPSAAPPAPCAKNISII